ncbi:Phosphoserine phosphatase [Methanosarcina barkeri 3]|uniref:phosphoserine phosphatase n=1 Tax=Methanosarcina barkeri 3 TaxID=1434107 RepID=A0A0E3SN69_METBA|nr:phosphoserine phosphatase SerB [Methanosarcina barkeri]AKB83881.1 Phosphoserine phosphatase [Methanosarcina barkeri 3]
MHNFTGNKMIVFDMDSTLIDAETIDELARAAGVVSKVEEITKKAMYGDLDFEQALIERVRLLEGLSIETALSAVNKIDLMPGAVELILYVKSRGYKTAMISGGFTICADTIGKMLGIDFIVSNELLVEDGCLTGKVVGPITQSDSKAKVFEELTRLNGVRPEQCVVVGDGANDACVFERAGFAIAFNPKPILREYADVVIIKKDLKAVIPVLESLSYQCCNQAQHVDIEQ